MVRAESVKIIDTFEAYFTVPSGAPTITRAMALSSTEAEVSWTEVTAIDRNGIITVYEVDYQPLTMFEGSEDVTVVNTTNRTIVLQDLHESVLYNISVRAFTSIGPGPFSVSVPEQTIEDGKF